MQSYTKLKATDLNNLKEKLNAELALRGGEGSVYGYQNYTDVAEVGGLTKLEQWIHTMGTNIDTGVALYDDDETIRNQKYDNNRNNKYISAKEYNILVANIAS